MTLQERLAALSGKGLLAEHRPSRAELQQHLDEEVRLAFKAFVKTGPTP